jgi:type IX secretion system PorP/SprF family membrane protein
MKVFILLFLNFLLISNLLSQQKVHFSNYIENAFYLNPATSSPLIKQVSLLYRTQWNGFEGAPNNSFISFQSPIFFNSNTMSYSSIGGYLQNDNIGAFDNSYLNFSYSYSFLLNERWRFSFGTFVGFQQVGLDVSNFESYHSNDPIIDVSNYNVLSPNLDLGITVSNKNNFISFSTKQLFESNWRKIVKSDLSKNINSYVFLFTKKLIFSDVSLSPNLLIDFSPQFNTLIILGLDFNYNNFLNIGISTKNDNSFISKLKLNISNNLKISYAFEFPYSSYVFSLINNHELMITYRTPILEKLKRTNLVSYF